MLEVISVHMPKTAGTAFRHVLYNVYKKDELLEDYPPDLMFDPNTDTVNDTIKIIHGHFQPATKYDKIFPSVKKIVWLRNPIFRLISEYFFAKTIEDKNNPIHLELLEKKLSLLEFATLPAMRNFQYRYIDGLSVDDFSFIGIQEFYSEDIQDLGKILKWPSFTVSSKNANKYPKYQEYLTETLNNIELVNQLSELNDADMKIYAQALQKRALRRQESEYIQFTLAEWNRSQFQVNQVNREMHELTEKSSSLSNFVDTCFKPIHSAQFAKHNDISHKEKVIGFSIDGRDSCLTIENGMLQIKGWCVGKVSEALSVRAICGGRIVNESMINKSRPDVAKFLDNSRYSHSGFEFRILAAYLARFSEVQIEAVFKDNSTIKMACIKAS